MYRRGDLQSLLASPNKTMGIENIKKKIEEEKIKIFGMLFAKDSLVNHPEVIFRLVLSYRALDQTIEMLNKEDDSTTERKEEYIG